MGGCHNAVNDTLFPGAKGVISAGRHDKIFCLESGVAVLEYVWSGWAMDGEVGGVCFGVSKAIAGNKKALVDPARIHEGSRWQRLYAQASARSRSTRART
jgi:hypothetical protein